VEVAPVTGFLLVELLYGFVLRADIIVGCIIEAYLVVVCSSVLAGGFNKAVIGVAAAFESVELSRDVRIDSFLLCTLSDLSFTCTNFGFLLALSMDN
jgi:hypothetical protein